MRRVASFVPQDDLLTPVLSVHEAMMEACAFKSSLPVAAWRESEAQLHALGGAHVHRAVECYHVALAMRPDDTFCSEMLSRALRDVASVDFDDAALLAEHRLAAARIDDDEDAAMA